MIAPDSTIILGLYIVLGSLFDSLFGGLFDGLFDSLFDSIFDLRLNWVADAMGLKLAQVCTHKCV